MKTKKKPKWKKASKKRLAQFQKAAKEGRVVLGNSAQKEAEESGSKDGSFRLWINPKRDCFGVEYSIPNFGFGGFAIGLTDIKESDVPGAGPTGRLKMLDSECMSRDFVKGVLCKLVDEADWDHDEKSTKKKKRKCKKKNPWNLLPCPFCASEDISMFEFGVVPDPHVRCNQCGASTREFDTRDQAIAAWSRREWSIQ